jgi:hypothetical protein
LIEDNVDIKDALRDLTRHRMRSVEEKCIVIPLHQQAELTMRKIQVDG